MYYSIVHVNKFRYSALIRESMMEVRMQPLTDGLQRCLSFGLSVRPQVAVQAYPDPSGNIVHHFDVPGAHRSLQVTAESMVELTPGAELPDALPYSTWNDLLHCAQTHDAYEMLLPSQFAQPTELLKQFTKEIQRKRNDDPLSYLRAIGTAINEKFVYQKDSTRVDSPIDEALQSRQGVCQDFSHIFIALARQAGIPCRYVSGYLCSSSKQDKAAAEASHAWVEAMLPGVGWVGFDPTNNSIPNMRHIRVAVGRDYADVPPTRGVFKQTGEVESKLSVVVRVVPASDPTEIREQTLQPTGLTASGDIGRQPEQQ